MASAGCLRKRSSSCMIAGTSSRASPLMRKLTSASITSVNGSRITTLTNRNSVLSAAMLTAVMGIVRNEKWKMAFAM